MRSLRIDAGGAEEALGELLEPVVPPAPCLGQDLRDRVDEFRRPPQVTGGLFRAQGISLVGAPEESAGGSVGETRVVRGRKRISVLRARLPGGIVVHEGAGHRRYGRKTTHASLPATTVTFRRTFFPSISTPITYWPGGTSEMAKCSW